MTRDPLDRPARPELLHVLDLEPEAEAEAISLLREGPLGPAWRVLLRTTALCSGAALVLSGIVCFFAFNWAHLHRGAKLGLVGMGVAAGAGLVAHLGLDRLAGKVALAAACVLTGVWLAVHGQVYQTGADAFELFRAWALLTLPWVLAARFQPLAAFWMLLVNVWLGLWMEQAGDLRLEGGGLAFFALNGAGWLVLETLGPRWPEWAGRALPRLLALPALGGLLVPAVAFILEPRLSSTSSLPLLLLLGTAGFCLWLYRAVRPDLFMLTAALGGLITVATAWLGHLLFQNGRGESCGLLFFLALVLVAEVGGAAAWLRNVHREAP